MAARKKSYTIREKRGWAYLDAWHRGRRYRPALYLRFPATCEADRRALEEEAASTYAEIVSGRRRPQVVRASDEDLADILGEWVAEIETLQPTSAGAFLVYAGHFVEHFDDLAVMASEESLNDYQLARLAKVLRRSVQKEMSAAMRFLRWCKSRELLEVVPARPPMARGLLGKRAGVQRAKPVDVTRAEAIKIIAALPLYSERKVGGKRFIIRDRMRFAWELGLRPATLDRLEVPRNWRQGSRVLELHDTDDKARFGRSIDLTAPAKAILEKHAPASGLIFGAHELDWYLKEAAAKVLDKARAKDFAAYDFRHGRARYLLDVSQDLRGVAYVLGHKQVTTTNRYVAPDRKAGKATLRAAKGR